MKKVKKGRYELIDQILDYRLIEVIFDDEPERPLYKIYKGKTCVVKWRSTEDLSEMDWDQIYRSDSYTKYADYVEEKTKEDDDEDSYTYNLFGEPVTSNKKYYSEPSPSYSYGNYAKTYTPKETTGFLDSCNKSDTLVIHCTDDSTDMLSQLYQGKGWDVINDGSIAEEELHKLMQSHSRIVMLGHGTSSGLINVQHGKGGKRFTVVDERYAEDLKNKKLFVIWCYADEFFNKIGVGQGQFITSNMPSEVWECSAAGCGDISASEMLENITYWSKLCADVIDKCLDGDVKSSVDYIRRNYIEKYGDHAVTRYNAIRTKVHGTTMEQNTDEVDKIYQQLNKPIPQVKERTYSYSRGGYAKYNIWGDEDEKGFNSKDDVIDVDFKDVQ